MRTPSSRKCRLDLAPPLADRFILGMVPIDCSPALLLRPFGFHLTLDTLPSGVRQAVASGPSWRYQLSPSCPFRRLHTFCFLRPARLLHPAFGYGAPHLSARGTLTLLNNALLSAHFRMADNSLGRPLGLPCRSSVGMSRLRSGQSTPDARVRPFRRTRTHLSAFTRHVPQVRNLGRGLPQGNMIDFGHMDRGAKSNRSLVFSTLVSGICVLATT